MASPLDELVDLPGGATDPQNYNPLPGELPAETYSRQATQQRQTNVIKARDLAQRGIPTFQTASGDITPIRDESGAALTSFDKSHGIAYDSKGEPKAINYGETGGPIISDPFANLPARTDMKTGDQYKVRPGLPWKWVGQDPEVAAEASTAQKDKEIAKESALMGRKLTLDHADLVSATQDRKELHSNLLGEVPTLQDPKFQGADPETIHKAIDEHFNSLYAAPEANAKTGYFGAGELSQDAQGLRAGLDAKKAAAHDSADKLFQLNDHITQLGDTVAEGRAQERASVETLLAHQRGEPGPLDEQPQQGEPGQVAEGNIDLGNRPVVHNADGTVSTVKSFSIGTDQGEVLIPQVVDGKMLSKDDAIAHFKATGEHLGVFDSPENADAYAEKLHDQQAIATAEDPVSHVTKAIDNGSIPDPAQPAALAAAHDAADAQKKAAELEKTNPTLADQFKGLAQGILHGLATGLAEIVKGAPALQKLMGPVNPLNLVTAAGGPDITGKIAGAVGGKIQEAAESDYDKSLQHTIGGKIGNFVGGALPFVGASLLPGGAAVTIPTTVSTLFSAGYAQTHDDAIAHGASPDKAEALGYLSGAINGVLGLPFKGIGKAISSVFTDTAPNAIKEALTGAFTNGIEIAGRKYVGAEATGIMLDRLKTAIESGAMPASAKADAQAGIEAIAQEMRRTPAERALIVGKAAAGAAGIGAGVQTAQNIVRQQYDPSTGTFQGVPEQALGFGALGALSTGFQQVARARQAKQALDLLAKKGGGEPPAPAGLPGPKAPPPETPPGEKPVTGREVDTAANEAASSPTNATPLPTQAQAEAGNYKKGHITVAGLDISVENPAGSTRQGQDYDQLMQSHYGYVKGTVGADKDHVDIFVKAGTPEDWKGPVYVVDQKDTHPIGMGDFDEHKAVIGVNSHEEAIAEYHANYQKDWKGFQAVTEFKNVDDFKQWLAKGEKGQPVSEKYGVKIGGDQVARGNIRKNAQGEPAVGKSVSEGTPAAEPAHAESAGAQPDNANAGAGKTGAARITGKGTSGTGAGEPVAPVSGEQAPASVRGVRSETVAQGKSAEQIAKDSGNPTTVLDAEQRLWRLTRKESPQLLTELRKQYGGHENYINVLNQHADEVQGKETGAFDAGDHITIGRQRFQVTSSDEGDTELRSTETGQRRPLRSEPTADLRAHINRGNYLLERQAELEKVPAGESKGTSAQEQTEPSKPSAIGEGLVAKPQRVGTDAGDRKRVSTPEEARSVLEANVKGNRQHLDRTETKVQYAPNASASGFRTIAGTGDVHLDLEKIAGHAAAVHDVGGNSEHYISSALQEEFIHSQQIKAAGNQFVQLYTSIWKGLTKPAKTALSEAYPDTSDQSALGAEYERMVIQHLNGDTITEAHHRNISKLLPFIIGKQTTELMNNITRVLSVAGPAGAAPAESAEPETAKAPAPKAEARGPPKAPRTKLGLQIAAMGVPFDVQDDMHKLSSNDQIKKYGTSYAKLIEAVAITPEGQEPQLPPGSGFIKPTPGRWASNDQYQYGVQKRRLTKAINAKDWKAVVKEADDFEKYYHDRGISVPDDWARWARAKDDAMMQLDRQHLVRPSILNKPPPGGWRPEDVVPGSFSDRRQRREALQRKIEENIGQIPTTLQTLLRTLLQSGPKKEPSAVALDQAERKINAIGERSTTEVGVRSEGGDVGEKAPLRQSGETAGASTEEKASEEKPAGRHGKLSGLTEHGRFQAFTGTGMPEKEARRLSKVGEQYLMPDQRAVLEAYADKIEKGPEERRIRAEREKAVDTAMERIATEDAAALTAEEQAAADELFSGLSASALTHEQLVAREPHLVASAALKFEDGTIVAGINHPDAWNKSRDEGVKAKLIGSGFLTNRGEYMTRDEVYKAVGSISSEGAVGERIRPPLSSSEVIGKQIPDIVQKAMPDDKADSLFKFARIMSKNGVDTPEALALKIPEAGRPYAQAIWSTMAAFNPKLQKDPDWSTLFSGLGARSEPAVVSGTRPPAGAVAGEAGGPAGREQAEGLSGQPGRADVAGGSEVAGGPGVGTGAGVADVGAEPQPALRPGEPKAPQPGTPAEAERLQEPDIRSRRERGLNHRILPHHEIAPRGDVTKTRANLEAIILLQKLEAEDREATPDEKEKLAKYVGWGGLSQAFDAFSKLGAQFNGVIKNLLTSDEYDAARRSTINAHYTSRDAINAIWQIVEHLGFKGGTVAEYGAGVGHFFGLMPSDLANASKLQAIERDEISSRIMSKLYPGARIRTGGLQDIKTKPNSVDLFVGNVPFAADGPRDDNYPTLNLHNYFLARELDDLKPGGVAVVISTHNTLDAQPKQREYLASKAELVGAIRLPNTAFKENAGTEVNADILIFRKPDAQRPAPEPFLATVEMPVHNADTIDLSQNTSPITVNEYFGRHPDMILGLPSREGSMYSADEPAIIPFKDGPPLADLLQAAAAKLPREVFGAIDNAIEPETEHAVADAKDKPHSFIYKDGRLYVVSEQRELLPIEGASPFNKSQVVKRAKDFIDLRETYKTLLAAQTNPEAAEADVEAHRSDLNKVYDRYVKRHGALNRIKSNYFSTDPEYGLLQSLENVRSIEEDGKRVNIYDKAAVFTRRTQFPYTEPTQADNVRDGMLTSLGYRGRIDPGYIAALTSKTVPEVEAQLESEKLAYHEPGSGLWQANDHYLSGNVRLKLKAAVKAAELDPRYERNVEALKAIQPKALSVTDINIRLGGAWVPQEVVTRFGTKLFNSRFTATYVKPTDSWVTAGNNYTPEATSTYAGGTMTGPELFRLALNLKTPRVMDRIPIGDGKYRQVFNPTKTAAAQAAQDKILAEFRRYINDTPDDAQLLEKSYNENFNGHVLPHFEGSHLTLPGSSSEVSLRPHQKDAIWRVIQDGYAMLAHAVGAGKTYVMIGASMEMRRLGLSRKPLLVVKNATLPQFAASFRKMYPSANVLVGSKEDLTKEKRNQFMARIASGDWDAVVVAQSSFDRLPSDPEREKAFIKGMLGDLEEGIREAKAKSNARDPSVKEMEKAKEKLEDQLKDLAKRAKDNVINFEQLGVDALFIDEAHDYKKPPFVTKMDRVGGLQKQISKRAFALLMKTRFIQEKNKGRNVILATGTPVTNTLGEAWHMLNLGAPHLLSEYGVDTFDRFVSNFATVEPSLEVNAAGNWVIKPRLKKFVNGPELLTMIRSGWDVLTTEELHSMFQKMDVAIPSIKGGKVRAVAVDITPPVRDYITFLKEVYKRYQDSTNKKEISAVPILAFMSGRVAALDPRLVNPRAVDHPNSKVNTLVKGVSEVYHETTPNKSAQLIFVENYRSMNTGYLQKFAEGEGLTLDMAEDEQGLEPAEGAGGFNLFDDIRAKLVANGIPTEEIAIINDYNTETRKEQLFNAVNAGRIRVVMGGTDKLGTGVNVQEKLVALWHLDTPWMPAQLEQREGRIVRQGNENPEVMLSSIGMKNTLDAGLHTKIAAKGKFFRQVLSGKFTGREFDDPTGPLILSAEEQQALLSGNPMVLKKVEVDNQVRNLLLEQEGHEAGKGDTRRRLQAEEGYIRETERTTATLEAGKAAIEGKIDGEKWQAKIGAQELNERKGIVAAIDRIVGAADIKKEVRYYDINDLKTEGQLILDFKINDVTVKVYGGMYTPKWAQEGAERTAGASERKLGSIMSIDGHDIYAGEAKTGNGILGVLSDLPEDLAGRIEARHKRMTESRANVAKFRALLEQPFEKAEELATAKAEQSRINEALVNEGKPAEQGAEELFNIGYTASPLLSRVDQAITDAKAALKALKAERPRMETKEGEVRANQIGERMNELENRIQALTGRRASVEKRRYEAALRGEMQETPYKWTPTGKRARPLAASVPQILKTPGLDINEAKEGVQSLLLPSAMSAEHLRAAELVGSKLGPMHRRQESTKANFQPDWMAFEKLGVHREDVPLVQNKGIQFMSDVSQGRVVAPALAKTRDKIEKVFANRMELLEKAGAPMQQVRENYFPGMWTLDSRRAFNQAMDDAVEKGIINPDTFSVNTATPQQETWIRERVNDLMDEGKGSDKDGLRYVSRKPFKGPETYKKQKVFDDIMTAVKFGLIPISNNPIDLVALKLAEIDRSIMANQVFQALRDKKQLKTIKPSEKTPDGWVPVLDKYGTVYGPPTVGEGDDEKYVGLRILGRRVVTAPVGDILNNYLSSSLYNNRYFGKLYSGWMGMANLLNQTQLGVGSAFHAGFTTAEAQISATANLIKDVYGLLRGNRSLKNLMASSKAVATATVETAMTGDKVLNAWREQDGPMDPRIMQVVRAAELAGAGFRLEAGLRTDQTSKFLSDWLNGHRLRAARRSPIAFIEMLAKPIMDFLVPRQKAGVFAHLAWRIIEQNPGKPLEELTPQFRAAWNRVDARLGQVRYDRLFINNVAKNVIQGTIRAPGWSGGTIAELGGSFKDAYTFFEEFAKTGKLPSDIPDRVAYVLALLITVAVINAALTFAFTGEAPHGLDYWAFRTGGKDLQGNQERFVLPTYVKDLMAYAKAPLTTLAHKLHPILGVFGDLIRNSDYYGLQIRDTDANVAKQAMQIVGYVAKSFTPFWIRGASKTTQEHGGFTTKAVLPLIGIMPATRQITQTKAQAIAAQINQATLPAAPKTQRQEARRLEKSTFTSQIRRGQTPNFSRALTAGTIKGSDIKELYKRASLSPLGVSIDHMTLENAEKVYSAATPLERQQLAGIMSRKRASSLSRKGRTMFTGF